MQSSNKFTIRVDLKSQFTEVQSSNRFPMPESISKSLVRTGTKFQQIYNAESIRFLFSEAAEFQGNRVDSGFACSSTKFQWIQIRVDFCFACSTKFQEIYNRAYFGLALPFRLQNSKVF